MGYYTTYTLTWDVLEENEQPNCEHAVPVGAKFCPECGRAVGSVGLNERVSAAVKNSEIGQNLESDVKWYEWMEDMQKFSLQFPTVLFTLDGKGEESGDVWRAYFVNGKVQYTRAVLTMEKFNPAKLSKSADTSRSKMEVKFI